MDEPTVAIRSLTPSSAILEVPEDDADTQSNSSMMWVLGLDNEIRKVLTIKGKAILIWHNRF